MDVDFLDGTLPEEPPDMLIVPNELLIVIATYLDMETLRVFGDWIPLTEDFYRKMYIEKYPGIYGIALKYFKYEKITWEERYQSLFRFEEYQINSLIELKGVILAMLTLWPHIAFVLLIYSIFNASLSVYTGKHLTEYLYKNKDLLKQLALDTPNKYVQILHLSHKLTDS